MKKSDKKHILVVSQYFYPEQFRINDICEEWVKRGYMVTVVTGIPNYPQGQFYEGYGLHKKRKETWNGIEIIRIPLVARGHNSIGLILNYMSFMITGFFWSHFTKVKADMVFNFETSPMTQVKVGCWFAKRRHIPNYLYVQDLWPENVEIVTGIHNLVIIKPIERMVKKIYKNCDYIFATSPSFVESICDMGAEKEKVYYWPQYAEEFYKPTDETDIHHIKSDDSFKMIFTGNIGYAQGLQIIPKAAQIIKEKSINATLYIVGDGRYKKELVREISEAGVEDVVNLIDRQPAENIPALLCGCDAAFVSFMDNELFEKTIPAKLQSYMACGMPIIAAASGETERVVMEAACGMTCKIGDAKGLADCIESMAAKSIADRKTMSQNALTYCQKNFNKKHLMDVMDEYFGK